MRKLFVLLFITASLNVFASDVRLISVTGTVEKSFKPDIVHLNLNIWGKGASAKSAQKNSADQNEIVKSSLETFKIKKTDVNTTSYNLNPEYVYDQKTGKSTISGYRAAQDLVVTLRKIEDAGPLVDSLTSTSKSMSGGVSVNSLAFDLDKRLDEQNALLGDAVRAAESQAEVLAKAAKVKLKGVYRLSPRGEINPIVMYEKAALMDAAPGEKRGASTTFMPGEVKISGSVSAEYIVE